MTRINKREQKKDEAWKKEPPKAGESKEGKKVGKYTFNWYKHHMALTVHKPADCLLGKQQKEEQQKKPFKANSATVAAAATLAVNPHFAALMAAKIQVFQETEEENDKQSNSRHDDQTKAPGSLLPRTGIFYVENKLRRFL